MKILFVLTLSFLPFGCVSIGVDYRLNDSTRINVTTNFRTIDVNLKGR